MGVVSLEEFKEDNFFLKYEFKEDNVSVFFSSAR